jgi:hypothetical protein
MKKIALLLLSLLIVLPFSVYAIEDVGRYQLLQGYYQAYDKSNGVVVDQKTVFKIDTTTGSTWRYYQFLNEDGKIIESWLSID